jgi:hypothetical protein
MDDNREPYSWALKKANKSTDAKGAILLVLVLAALLGVFLVTWRSAIPAGRYLISRFIPYPAIAAMNPAQFDEYKKNIAAQLERDCKQGALAQNSVDGKLPIQISKRCECIARVLPDIFSQADFA